MIMHLEVKILLAVNIDKFPELLACDINLVLLDPVIDFAVNAAAETNNPSGMFIESFFVNPGFIILAIEVSQCNKL